MPIAHPIIFFPNIMIRRIVTCLLVHVIAFYAVLPVSESNAWDHPFNHSSNWGGTGLMEIPTARILDDGAVRIGYAQADPYRWYSGCMGALPGLEIGGRLTELHGIEGNLGSDYGDYKDKAFDVKYQLLPESKWLPALAIGLNDFHGTKLYPAEYVVVSRQLFPLDFTIGLGTKRLQGDLTLPFADQIPLPFIDEVGLFGGVEWAASDWLHLMAEYNPIQYEDDEGRKVVPEGASSPFNVGARLTILPGIDLGLSYQRGDTLALSGNFKFIFGKPILPKRADPPKWASSKPTGSPDRDLVEMVKDIRASVQEAGFKNVVIYSDGNCLIAEFENTKYFSHQKAAGRVLRILLFYSMPEIEYLNVVFTRRDLPFLRVSIRSEIFKKYLYGEISDRQLSNLIKTEAVDSTYRNGLKKYTRSQNPKRFIYDFKIKPDFKTYLNDPSGFFKYKTGILPTGTVIPWKGGEAYARYDIPFYSNISSSVPLLKEPVRSDSWKYLGDSYKFDRLIFDQAFQLSERTIARISTGYFEYMYAGIGGEILTFLKEGNPAFGIESDWVKKREPDTQLDLQDFESYTILGNFYFQYYDLGLTFIAQYGRFLAGDIGWLFTASREFENGAVVGAWYSFTDTDDLTGFNRGYHHKGVFVSVPLRWFTDYESRIRYGYGISPWSRDVAATVYHLHTLFGLVSDLTPAKFKNNLKMIKE
jgi:exopolysaccharide biosynthesis protein YbjH